MASLMATPYATPADLETRYGSSAYLALTDRDRDGVADEAVVTAALATASAEIDGWLAKRYPPPLAGVVGVAIPDRLRDACVAIAWFHLHSQGLRDDAPERRGYTDQIKWLQSVAGGLADVPGLAGPGAGGGAGGDGAVAAGPTRVFSRDSLRGF